MLSPSSGPSNCPRPIYIKLNHLTDLRDNSPSDFPSYFPTRSHTDSTTSDPISSSLVVFISSDSKVLNPITQTQELPKPQCYCFPSNSPLNPPSYSPTNTPRFHSIGSQRMSKFCSLQYWIQPIFQVLTTVVIPVFFQGINLQITLFISPLGTPLFQPILVPSDSPSSSVGHHIKRLKGILK